MQLKEPLTDDEAKAMLELQQQLDTASPKQLRHLRRRIRYRVFRIREGRDEFDHGLKKVIEGQLSPDQSLKTFTFNWDLSPKDPLKVITTFDWITEGGYFETVNVLCDDGIVRPEKICQPTAFTKQA